MEHGMQSRIPRNKDVLETLKTRSHFFLNLLLIRNFAKYRGEWQVEIKFCHVVLFLLVVNAPSLGLAFNPSHKSIKNINLSSCFMSVRHAYALNLPFWELVSGLDIGQVRHYQKWKGEEGVQVVRRFLLLFFSFVQEMIFCS